jgi:hypothetical protein
MRFLRRETRRARIAPPDPPLRGQNAAPQTPLHKVWLVQSADRFALVLSVIDP